MPNINPFIDDLLTVVPGTKFVAKDGAAPAGHHTIEQIITYLGGSFAASLGPDDNYATDAEKVKLSNLSGTNTGDQTSIVGLTGTKAQFNTAVTGGDIQFVGDAPTAHTHTAAEVTDFAAAADARIAAAVLNALSDVILTAPSSGQVLKYNGTNWVNGTDVSGGSGAAWVAASLTVSDGKGAFEVSTTVASVGVTPASVILTKLAPALDTDENDPELLSLDTLIAVPGTDQFTLLATFRELTSGIIKIQYQIAA
jgi:hypothetical protein